MNETTIPTQPITWRALAAKMDAPVKVKYNDVEFYAARRNSKLYFNDMEFGLGQGMVTVYDPASSMGYSQQYTFSGHAWDASEAWSADSSCAYLRYKPKGHEHPQYQTWLDYYLAAMDYSRAVTCYLTKLDGKVRDILPVLINRGFNQVAKNKSIHSGGYNVYLLVHPGTADTSKFLGKIYNKKNDDKAIEELE